MGVVHVLTMRVSIWQCALGATQHASAAAAMSQELDKLRATNSDLEAQMHALRSELARVRVEGKAQEENRVRHDSALLTEAQVVSFIDT